MKYQRVLLNIQKLKVFEGKEALLVTRDAKGGYTKYLPDREYMINDHAYILCVKHDCPLKIDLQWLTIQYKQGFLAYGSSTNNGTWNMTGSFT